MSGEQGLDFEPLKNSGIVAWGATEPMPRQRTIIVLGAPRGGTSAIAGTLDKMGIFLGDLAKPPVFEDLHLATLLENNKPERAAKLIEKYNEQHDVWGFKRPGLAFSITEHHELFRNPRYIIIYRDILAAANRNAVSSKASVMESMKRLLDSYQHIIEFLEQHQPQALLVSYEKLIADPQPFIAQLAQFSGLAVDPVSAAQIREFIQPEPPNYLDASRVTAVFGEIEQMDAHSVSGWARYRHKHLPNPPRLVLYRNGKAIGETTADLPTTIALELKPFEGEPRGFHFALPEGTAISKSDAISVRAVDDIRDFELSSTLKDARKQTLTGMLKRLFR